MVENTNVSMMVSTYLIYVMVSIGLTVWVGRTLNKNGRVFLVDTFKGKETLADSVNHLLLVGFYLINIGFVSLALKYGDKPVDYVGAVEFLSTKIGFVIVVLGVMHFFNMMALVRFGKSRLFRTMTQDQNAENGDAKYEPNKREWVVDEEPAPRPAG